MDKTFSLNEIWKEYERFCRESYITQNTRSESAPDFLGYLSLRFSNGILRNNGNKEDSQAQG